MPFGCVFKELIYEIFILFCFETLLLKKLEALKVAWTGNIELLTQSCIDIKHTNFGIECSYFEFYFNWIKRSVFNTS